MEDQETPVAEAAEEAPAMPEEERREVIKLEHRSVEVRKDWVDEETRTVRIAVSSEEPVDIFAIHEDGRELKVDIKAERWRKPTLLRPKPTRVYRSLSPVQKRLGVLIGYVSVAHQLLYIVRGNGSRPIRME